MLAAMLIAHFRWWSAWVLYWMSRGKTRFISPPIEVLHSRLTYVRDQERSCASSSLHSWVFGVDLGEGQETGLPRPFFQISITNCKSHGINHIPHVSLFPWCRFIQLSLVQRHRGTGWWPIPWVLWPLWRDCGATSLASRRKIEFLLPCCPRGYLVTQWTPSSIGSGRLNDMRKH